MLRDSLCCVFVQIDLGRGGDDFACRVMAAGRANVMRTLHFTAVVTFVGIGSDKRVVRAPVVAAGFGNFILLDGHDGTL